MRTFDTYEPIMLGLFQRMAELADAEGEIEKYDAIAAELGGPSSEDLGISSTRCASFEVPVRVTIVREVSVTVHVCDQSRGVEDDEIDESDFISDHYDAIEEAIREEYSDIDSIEDISVSQSETIRFSEWAD